MITSKLNIRFFYLFYEEKVMKYSLHKANSRGHVNHGWLNTYHTFSFADYYCRDRMNFGVLRVINEDTIIGKNGFGTHPHSNMEIITFPISGALEHHDSMGNRGVISHGEIQVMSAGTGVYHSEFNANSNEDVHLLQIWILTGHQNVEPRYSQYEYKTHLKRNEFLQIVSPNREEVGAWIHQDGYVSYGEFDADSDLEYILNSIQNGLYVFVIEGNIEVNGVDMLTGDGAGFIESTIFQFKIHSNSKIILFDVSMNV